MNKFFIIRLQLMPGEVSLPDQAEIHKLTQDGDSSVRYRAAVALGASFSDVPDKTLAWQDLHRLTQDDDSFVRRGAADALGASFSDVPDKTLAWQDLDRLTQDDDRDVRYRAAVALGASFSDVPNKTLAWQDLDRLTQDDDSDVRYRAADALGASFSDVPDKTLAWQDLIRLTQDDDRDVRYRAAVALRDAFSHVPNKTLAWQDLHRLTQDDDSFVRRGAADALGASFSDVPNKTLAWQDLHRLTQDDNSFVRRGAADALGASFSDVPNKTLAWQDLIRLTQDDDSFVRRGATDALGASFSDVPNKTLAWQDLHRLTQDDNSFVRRGAADALGASFSHVPDKTLAWQDLHRLTQDDNSFVRMYAYHSLGRATIFKATEASDRNTMKTELEAAVTFFEKSSQESVYSPARFCCPFYRSYLAITFQEAKEDEVQRYLTDAKNAVGGSASKDELLKAVENLAQALKESQRQKGRSLEEIAIELNAYRWYCDKAASHMDAAEDKAPGAVKLMRKGNLFLDEQIQATIAEIQKMARRIFEIACGSGTKFEAPVSEINNAAKALSLEDIHNTQRSVTRIISQLEELCLLLHDKNKRELVEEVVVEVKQATEFPDKIDKLELVLAYIVSEVKNALQLENVRSDIKQVHSDVKHVLVEVGIANKKLDEITYSVFKQGINSGNVVSTLTSITAELKKLHQLALQDPQSSLIGQETLLKELRTDMNNRFSELKELLLTEASNRASNDDIKKVLDELEHLKPPVTWDSKFWNYADKGAILAPYISFLEKVLTVCMCLGP